MNQNTKTLLGALIAAALAIAVYYGVINQQQASSIQTQTNQTLGTGPVGQPPVTPSTQNSPMNQNPPMTTQAPTAPAPGSPITPR